MALSVVDICNLSLTRLGQHNIIGLNEQREEARLCRQLYDRVRKAVLAAHPWNFALTTAELVQLPFVPADWSYSYQLPTDLLTALVINDDDEIEFEIMAEGLCCDLSESVVLRYTKDVTDTTKFTEPFNEALSYRLAADLAMPLTKKPEMVNGMLALYRGAAGQGFSHDAKQQRKAKLLGQSFLNARS